MSSTRDEAKTPQDEQKIVEEFLYLLEKSHQFFSGLRYVRVIAPLAVPLITLV